MECHDLFLFKCKIKETGKLYQSCNKPNNTYEHVLILVELKTLMEVIYMYH